MHKYLEWLLPQHVPEQENQIYIKFSMGGVRMTNRGKCKAELAEMEIIVPGDSLSTLKSLDNCHLVGLGAFPEEYDQLQTC